MKIKPVNWILLGALVAIVIFGLMASGWQFAAIHFVNGQAYVHATPMFK